MWLSAVIRGYYSSISTIDSSLVYNPSDRLEGAKLTGAPSGPSAESPLTTRLTQMRLLSPMWLAPCAAVPGANPFLATDTAPPRFDP